MGFVAESAHRFVAAGRIEGRNRMRDRHVAMLDEDSTRSDPGT